MKTKLISRVRVSDISRDVDQLVKLNMDELMKLPPPYDKPGMEPEMTEPRGEWRERYATDLDGYVGIDIPWKPRTREDEENLVKRFLEGLRKLLSSEGNWTFLQPLLLSLEYCAKCQTCSEACPIYVSSGMKEVYRPTYRSEVLRRIWKKYLTKFGKLSSGDISLNAKTILRLGELAYRCTLCRRCAQTCPLGLDNGLITHEIRKLFSSELGIAPKPLHELGAVQHLKVGSST
ncbi:MAG: (Fe-S)-binding protein, partial [Nitrososphaerota archaeon]